MINFISGRVGISPKKRLPLSGYGEYRVFNKINTPDYFASRLYDVENTEYTPSNKETALAKSSEWGDKIPYGVIYQREGPSYEDGVTQLQGESLIKKKPEKIRDVAKIFEDHR